MDENKIEFFEKNSLDTANNYKVNQGNRTLKKVILYGTLSIIIITLLIFLFDNGPGPGNGLGMIWGLAVMPVLFLFCPIYLVVLALRYSREKNNMDSLDKATFFLFLFLIVSQLIMVIIQAN